MAKAITVGNSGEYIDQIVEILQTKVPFDVSEVVKGGSLGQGTAVPGKFDLDLVLYSRDISPDSVKRDGVDRYLDTLDQVLGSSFGRNYCLEKKTPFALQFTLYGMLEVDLLPSPYWTSSQQFFDYLSGLTQSQRRKFQCSEAKWEKRFFQEQPNEVKEYIKRAKVWRNEKWPSHASGTGRPKSFLLSLLILEAYRRVCQGNAAARSDPGAITRKVKNMVKEHRNLRVNWVGKGAEHHGRYLREYEGEPHILDPANPYNNVYITGIHSYRASNIREDRYNEGDGNWTNMVRFIDSLDLTRPV